MPIRRQCVFRVGHHPHGSSRMPGRFSCQLRCALRSCSHPNKLLPSTACRCVCPPCVIPQRRLLLQDQDFIPFIPLGLMTGNAISEVESNTTRVPRSLCPPHLFELLRNKPIPHGLYLTTAV